MTHPEADLVLTGGTVHTLVAGEPPRSALAVRGDTIVAIGGEADVSGWIGPHTVRIDLSGRTVIPGVVDTHCHLASDADGLNRRVDCRDLGGDVASIADILDRMAAFARVHPDLPEVVAVGSPLQEFRLAERRRPTRAELDVAVPDRPAYITFGGHILVANSAAVTASGVGPGTPDPPGGIVERESDGTPNGVFRERSAFGLVVGKHPSQPFQEYKDNVHRLLLAAAARGVTTIHEIVRTRDEVRVYQALEREGRLPVRVQLIVRVIEAQFARWSLLDLGLQPGFGSDLLRLGGVKMSIDGGFTARQGMFHGVADEPADNHPLQRISQEDLDETVLAYHAAGVRVCVHAIGDRSLDMILASFEAALRAHPRADHRHRVEHMANFIVSDDQMARASALGVVPVPNPSMLYYLTDAARRTLTEARLRRPLPVRSLLDRGFVFAPGSDGPGYWPLDPLRDAGFCVSRRTADGIDLGSDEAITAREALHAITAGAAWLGFAEERLGTLAPGKLADLVVLDRDPLADGDLAAAAVSLTVMDGRIRHRAGAVA